MRSTHRGARSHTCARRAAVTCATAQASKPLLGAEHGESAAIRTALALGVSTSLRLIHPFMPHVTERLWRHAATHVNDDGTSIMLASFPDAANTLGLKDPVRTGIHVPSVAAHAACAGCWRRGGCVVCDCGGIATTGGSRYRTSTRVRGHDVPRGGCHARGALKRRGQLRSPRHA